MKSIAALFFFNVQQWTVFFSSSFMGNMPIKELNRRDAAMCVLSLFYWMLTKRKSLGLRGDCHPSWTRFLNDGLQLEDKTALAALASSITRELSLIPIECPDVIGKAIKPVVQPVIVLL
jgi:hypothetical protein